VIKEDRRLMKSDWKECYGILVDLFGERKFPAKWFSFEHYLAAKTLVASRAFEVDDIHGFGMVPLADLYASHNYPSRFLNVKSLTSGVLTVHITGC
jgi:SET domain-containing protein 6